jgi:hypothetical protein
MTHFTIFVSELLEWFVLAEIVLLRNKAQDMNSIVDLDTPLDS